MDTSPRPTDASKDAPARQPSSSRHAIRNRPPIHPSDPDQIRRRALSEVVRADLPGGKWRVVSAWSSLRRSLDSSSKSRSASDDTDSANPDPTSQPPAQASHHYHGLQPTLATPSRITSERRDSTLPADRPSASGRKRVSLFLRRRRIASATQAAQRRELVLESGEVYETEDGEDSEEARARAHFRRAQSGLVPPVSLAGDAGGEGGRYLQYAAEIDDDSFERLRDMAKGNGRKFVRPGAIRIVKSPIPCGAVGVEGDDKSEAVTNEDVFENFAEDIEASIEGDGQSDEIVGEICLEDFADVGSEDFDFLENQSVDLSGLEPTSFGRMSRGPSLKLDSQKLRWIGNEADFAAFFAEVGLDEWFDVEGPRELKEFEVPEETVREWELAAREHNEQCVRWGTKAVRRIVDIREFEKEFRDGRRRRTRRKD